MAERYHNRLKLPIIGAKYIHKIGNRSQLQDREFMEGFVAKMKWESFTEMKESKRILEAKYAELAEVRAEKEERISYLEDLLDQHKDYEPYQKVNAEYWKLKKAEEKNGKHFGFLSMSAAEEYLMKHQAEINTYKIYRDLLKDRIREADKKIVPKKWKEEMENLRTELAGSQQEYADTVWALACIETLEHNKKDLQRMIENERNEKERKFSRMIKRDTTSL